MTSLKNILPFFLLMAFPTLMIAQNNKPVIEIYLVNKVVFDSLAKQHDGQYFSCLAADLPATAFINDSEITGYEIKADLAKKHNQKQLYNLHLSASGQEKLQELKDIPPCCGTRFVIAVNRQPVYGGYFWDYTSSSGCGWITILAVPSESLAIERGLPYDNFTDKHPDPRSNAELIDALKATNRLIEN